MLLKSKLVVAVMLFSNGMVSLPRTLQLPYASRNLDIENAGNTKHVVHYKQPDNGFRGAHVLIAVSETLKPGDRQQIRMAKNSLLFVTLGYKKLLPIAAEEDNASVKLYDDSVEIDYSDGTKSIYLPVPEKP